MRANVHPIRDYGIIGNCQTCALVAPDGGIDWLCLPLFDSPSFFGAIVDSEKGGSFRICPSVSYRLERFYAENSAVLVTRFITADSTLELRDFFPMPAPGGFRWPWIPAWTRETGPRILIRRIHVTGGTAVPIEWRLEARPKYASSEVAWKRPDLFRGMDGRVSRFRCDETDFVTDMPSAERHGRLLTGRFEALPGRQYFASLDHSAERAPLDADEIVRMEDSTLRYWRHWDRMNGYRGPYEAEVRRSAVTLKLLTYPRTGGFVAAPTTSLPERPAGDQNWDYRYVWLRDAAFFINAFQRLGYRSEARAFLDFVVKKGREARRAGRDGSSEPLLDVLYPIHPGSSTEERFLTHLSGYGGARPVRIGNRATRQLQIDNCAHILEAVRHYQEQGGRLSPAHLQLAEQMADDICAHWRKPDNGIWEMPDLRQYTYGKIVCWAALGSAARMLPGESKRLTAAADDIRSEVWSRALMTRDGRPFLSACYGEAVSDASTLLAFLTGFCDKDVAKPTREAIDRDLLDGAHLYRNLEKRRGEREASFVICGFWRVRHLIREGELDAARAAMDALVASSGPLGLFAEEIDPADGSHWGNFPQAFSHLGLIDAALDLREAAEHA